MISKKIVIFIPSIEGGGVEKNLFSITNYLSKHFKEVILLTSGEKHKAKFFNTKIISPFLNVENLGYRNIKYILCLIKLFFFLIFNKSNCIVFSFQANIYAIIIAKLLNKKIIVRANSSPSGWTLNKIKIKIFRKIIQMSDGIIVNSDDFKKEFDKKFNTNCKRIYNPVDIKHINKQSKKKIQTIFRKKNNLRLINIGRLVDQKDQITILKSIKLIKEKYRFKNFQLVLIGQGSLNNILKKYISENSLDEYVKILPFKKNPYPYLKQSDIFILSSKFEGLPNVLLEAAALKIFIISTKCPTGPREILNNGKFGDLYKVGDYKNLAKLILKNKKKNYKFKTTQCFKNLKKFNYQKNLNEYLKYIQSIF